MMERLLQPSHLLIIYSILLLSSVLGIIAVVLLYADYQRIPRGFRRLEPALVFLLLIPCFSLVWNFFVFPKLSDSFKAYFDSIGDTSVGNCGRDLAIGYAITSAVSVIPFLGCLTGIVAVVLLILFLVKANELKNRIPLTA